MKYIVLVWQKKTPIIIISALFSLLFLFYSCYNTYYRETMVISFIYPDSENGKYPDGTRFNIYDILSDDVLENAIKEYNKEIPNAPITRSDIDGKIFLTEYLEGSVQQKVEDARNMGLDYRYFANEFVVTSNMMYRLNIDDWEHLFGILPYVNNTVFVNKLYESYTHYFMQEHAEKNIMSGLLQDINYEDYDYIEIADVFEQKIDKYTTYLSTKNSENGSFRSEQTQLSFNDLIKSFTSLKDVQINNLKSFVSSSKLSKNPSEFVSKLMVENETNRLDYNKYSAESNFSKQAMDQYDHTFEENVIVAGKTEDNEIYQTRAKTAYDDITNRALEAGVNAENILKDIEENERLISLYSAVAMSDDEKNRLTQIAEDMISNIEAATDDLVEKANVTVEEYLSDKSSNYIRRDIAGKSYISTYTIIKTGMVFAFAAFVMILYICLKDYYSGLRKMRASKSKVKKQKLEFDTDISE